MIKTEKEIQTDIISMLKDSELSADVTGCVYRATPDTSYRPRDSKLEDIEVIFTSGNPQEIQSGVVTVNIYVPDIDPYGNGVLVEDGQRVERIERMAQDWISSLTCRNSNYRFLQTQAVFSAYNPDISQHFVCCKILYRYYDGE